MWRHVEDEAPHHKKLKCKPLMYPHTVKHIQSNLAALSFIKHGKPPPESHLLFLYANI